MALKAGYLLIAGAGGIAVWSGVRGKRVTDVFRGLIGGENIAKLPNSNQLGGISPAAPTFPGNAQAQAAQKIASKGLPVSPNGPIDTAQKAQQYAFSLFPKFGWTVAEEQPLINLWNQESNWNANAVNPSSGAYGIPQALPSANGHPFPLGWGGAVAQILWGLTYIKGRYGNPSAAWAHEQANNWY